MILQTTTTPKTVFTTSTDRFYSYHGLCGGLFYGNAFVRAVKLLRTTAGQHKGRAVAELNTRNCCPCGDVRILCECFRRRSPAPARWGYCVNNCPVSRQARYCSYCAFWSCLHRRRQQTRQRVRVSLASWHHIGNFLVERPWSNSAPHSQGPRQYRRGQTPTSGAAASARGFTRGGSTKRVAVIHPARHFFPPPMHSSYCGERCLNQRAC